MDAAAALLLRPVRAAFLPIRYASCQLNHSHCVFHSLGTHLWRQCSCVWRQCSHIWRQCSHAWRKVLDPRVLCHKTYVCASCIRTRLQPLLCVLARIYARRSLHMLRNRIKSRSMLQFLKSWLATHRLSDFELLLVSGGTSMSLHLPSASFD